MSRIGKKPIDIPAGVKIAVEGNVVTVEGKGKLSFTLPQHVAVAVEGNQILVSQTDEAREASAMHGLARSIINNMVIGVTDGFKKVLAIVGVGYKASLSGQKLTLSLGFSHQIVYELPATIKAEVTPENQITISGCDKQLVGEVAAEIRRFRPPEPYKGKGIRYVNERIVLKEGKSVG
ncbi:MAG: 50S ribosomal protein L6 [Victivallaceae bacterium]|nr:50S ribosomal protein L6 [Victivallaceae bacterium]